MIDCRECLVNMIAYHWVKAPQLYHVSYCLSSCKVHLVISISFEVCSRILMIDCWECLVNMIACIPVGESSSVISCILLSFHILKSSYSFSHVLDCWLTKCDNSHSYVSWPIQFGYVHNLVHSGWLLVQLHVVPPCKVKGMASCNLHKSKHFLGPPPFFPFPPPFSISFV